MNTVEEKEKKDTFCAGTDLRGAFFYGMYKETEQLCDRTIL